MKQLLSLWSAELWWGPNALDPAPQQASQNRPIRRKWALRKGLLKRQLCLDKEGLLLTVNNAEQLWWSPGRNMEQNTIYFWKLRNQKWKQLKSCTASHTCQQPAVSFTPCSLRVHEYDFPSCFGPRALRIRPKRQRRHNTEDAERAPIGWWSIKDQY